jgi:thiol-disulfide isomerase/thioredoxin
MKLTFNSESDFSSEKLSKLENILGNKNTMVLNHSNYCGHCHAMRGEFEKFKKSTKTNVVEIEGGVLETLKKHPKIYKKLTPKDGSMYFPMIIVFIKRKDKTSAKRVFYEGPRTEKSFHDAFPKKSEKVLKKKPLNKNKKA